MYNLTLINFYYITQLSRILDSDKDFISLVSLLCKLFAVKIWQYIAMLSSSQERKGKVMIQKNNQ